MTIACPSCRRPISVPPDKAATPNLKARCRCGPVFVVAEAAGAAAPAPAHVASPAVAAAAPAAAPRPSSPPPVPPAVVAGAIAAATPLPKIQPPPVPRSSTATPPPPPVTAPAASPAPVAARTPTAVNWRRCANHRQAASVHVCPACLKGYCDACTQKVQTAALCPSCEGLCVTTTAYLETQEKARARSRSMIDDVGLIASYPFGDKIGYVMLALFTWFFGMFSSMAIMYVLSKGVLVWYCFNAVSKVAIGNVRTFMPDGDITDIVRALRLSFAALVISAGPLVLCAILLPGAAFLMSDGPTVEGPRLATVHAQPIEPSPEPAERDEDEERAEAAPAADEPSSVDTPRGAGGVVAMLGVWILAVGAAFLWWILYAPVALIVAALSKSVLSTLNPLIGVDTIRKMGSTYWQALAIYLVIVITQTVVGFLLDKVPVAGGLLRSFVDAYGYPAVGCTLGLAVYKKAAELGWD